MTGRTGPVGVGVVGAGFISAEYLRNLTSFPDLRVVCVADIDEAKAARRAHEFGVPCSGGLVDVLRHDDIEVVVNLTVPSAHAQVTHAALEAGRHVWVEKPFATDLQAGSHLLEEAGRRGLRIAGAPDTFLGAGNQSALSTVRRDVVGKPLSAFASMQGPGPELWHPSPAFYYSVGAGPLFDMGPYYLTTLIQIFGPIEQVTARVSTSREWREMRSGPNAGQSLEVHVPTHYVGTIDFEDGGFAQVVFSFDSPIRRTGVLEVNGTRGVVAMPDPNTFEEDHRVWGFGDEEPTRMLVESPGGHGRGLGVLDLARSVRSGVQERASGALACHVLDAMAAMDDAASARLPVPVTSSVAVPDLLPAEWDPTQATL